MALVVMAAVWKQICYNFLFFLAGLQSIPKSVIEAAAIDGAGPMRRFWTIVFPLLSPTTFFLMVVNIVYVFFDTFGIIDAVTGGGPAGATTTLVYKVYADGQARRRPRQFGGAIGGADGDRHRADRDPVPLCRAQGAILMVEHRPWNDLIAYAILTFGVVIVAFPVYLAFIASTHDAATVVSGHMPLLPGGHVLENYYRAVFVGGSRTSPRAGRPHDAEFVDHGARHRGRQDLHLDPVGLCGRVFPLSVPQDRVLDHLRHADAAGRGPHLSDLQGRRPTCTCSTPMPG